MKHLLATIGFLTVPQFLAAQVQAGLADPIANRDSLEIISMENAWCASTVSGDTTVVTRILADSYIGTTGAGRRTTKQTEVDAVKNASGTARTTSCRHTNVAVQLYGDAAVFTATMVASGINNGIPFTDRASYGTDTYIRRNGRWWCVASAVTRVAAVPK